LSGVSAIPRSPALGGGPFGGGARDSEIPERQVENIHVIRGGKIKLLATLVVENKFIKLGFA